MKILPVAIVLGSMAKLALAQPADGVPQPDAAVPPAPAAQPAPPAPVVTPVVVAAPLAPAIAPAVVAAIPAPDALVAAVAPVAAIAPLAAVAPVAVVAPIAIMAPFVTLPRRPIGYSVGLGFGYQLPDVDLKSPNVTSVRLRFPRGLTIEPRLILGSLSDRTNDGVTETSHSANVFSIGAVGRMPIRSRGRIDFVAVGGASYAVATDNPVGENGSLTARNTTLEWGFGLDYWLNSNWQISGTVTNPLLQWSNLRNEAAGFEQDDAATSFGAVFDPDLLMMIHMYY